MSDNQVILQALQSDPELLERFKGASSTEERVEICEAAGLPAPSFRAPTNEEMLAGVDGAGGTESTSLAIFIGWTS